MSKSRCKCKDDCADCKHSGVSFPGPYHENGMPWCIIERPTRVLSLVQGETLRRGHMVPDRSAKKKDEK